MKKYILILSICFSSVIYANPRVRPTEWATPVIGSELNNFYKVSSNVFRSEQPTKKSFAQIQNFGISSILNLRPFHTDNDETKGLKLELYSVKMHAGSVTPEQIFKSLSIIKNSNGPILIHCRHGSDRTGVIIASYRIVFENWSKEEAIDEMRNGGYGYHSRAYPNLIDVLESLNVKDLKKRLGL